MLKMTLCFLFVMAILHMVCETWRFSRSFKSGAKYESQWKRTVITFASISYIISYLIYCV